MAPASLESRVSTSHVWMVEYFIIVQWKRSKKYFLNVLTLVDDSFRFLCIYHLHCADIIFPLFAITHISMGLNAHALYSFDGAADQVDYLLTTDESSADVVQNPIIIPTVCSAVETVCQLCFEVGRLWPVFKGVLVDASNEGTAQSRWFLCQTPGRSLPVGQTHHSDRCCWCLTWNPLWCNSCRSPSETQSVPHCCLFLPQISLYT